MVSASSRPISTAFGRLLNQVGAMSVCWAVIAAGANGVARGQAAAETSKAADQSATPGEALPGLLSSPAAFPGMKRWQLMHSTPRGFVRSVAWSPDGRRVAASDAGNVRICDVDSLVTVQFLVGHVGRIHCVRWSPDGVRIASVGRDGTLRIWRSDGKALHVLKDHGAPVRGVTWSPDSKRLASAGSDGTVRVWNADGVEQFIYKEHQLPVHCVAWSNDGAQLASGDVNGVVHIWNSDGSGSKRLDARNGIISAVSWKPDGKKIVASSMGNYGKTAGVAEVASIAIWNVESGAVEQSREHRGPVVDCAWSPSGKQIAYTAEKEGIYFWDPQTGNVSAPDNRGLYSAPTSLAWSPDDVRLVIGGMNAMEIVSGEDAPRLRSPHFIGGPRVAWHRDGKKLAATGWTNQPRIWNVDGTLGPAFEGEGGNVRSMTWNPDGSEILLMGTLGPAFYDQEGKRLSKTLPEVFQNVVDVAWSLDGKEIAASTFRNEVVRINADGTGEPTYLTGHTDRIQRLLWSPDGKWIASASEDDTVRIWSADGQEAQVLSGFSGDVDGLGWLPDSQRVATGYGNGDWQIWNIDGNAEGLQSGHFESVMCIACRSDGKQIVSLGWDETMQVWSADGKREAVHDVHSGPMHHAAWSRDGKHLATASTDRTLRIWSPDEKCEVVISILNDGDVASFNAQGKLMTGDPDAVEQNFLYYVENADGTTEILRHPEFLKRTGRAP